MNLQSVGAVFKVVSYPGALGRQFLRLADRNEAGAQSIGQRGGKDKTARLDSQHDIHAHARILILQAVDDPAQTLLVFQQRRDVVKEDPCFGKVGDFADELFEMVQKASYSERKELNCCTAASCSSTPRTSAMRGPW